jgi:5-methylcytosine-specific restriction endonuclease McrA
VFGWFTTAVLELWAFERQVRGTRRPRVSQRRLKQRLYRRDNGMCRYCGRLLKFDEATIDEVVPLVHGGRRILSNTVISCWQCNHNKGPLLLEEEEDLSVDALKARWASLDTVRNGELDPRRLPR